MEADADFTGYVAARWPALVRTLVLLGCPAGLAPDVAATGLGRCRRGWREAVERDDLDVVVHRAVLAAWQERLRGSWWTELRPSSDSGRPAPDLSALDRLTPDVRTGLVLRRFAALDAAQAAAVAGQAAGGPIPGEPDEAALRTTGEGVAVFGPPDEQVLAGPRTPWHRRRAVLTVVGLVTLALVVGAWAVIATRPVTPAQDSDAVGLDPVEPTRSRNAAEVAWYADDVLHLANATYVLPTLRDLAVVGSGAVYGDVDGRVVHLDRDGVRTLLGTKDPKVRLVASEPFDWVAWVDPAGANPRLLVYDVAKGDIIGELDLPASRSGPLDPSDTRPVAIDEDTVFFVSAEGAFAWRPTEDQAAVPLEPPPLLDVSSGNLLSQPDNERIRLDEPVPGAHDVPGRGGELSADGNYAWTHDPADGAVVVYDVRTGERVDVRPPGDLNVVDVVLAPEGAITYLTVDPDGFASQEGVNDSNPIRGELVTCQLDDGSCEVLATAVLDSEAPILGR